MKEREVKWVEMESPPEFIPDGTAAILATLFQGRTWSEMCLQDLSVVLRRRKDTDSQVYIVDQGGGKNKLKRMMEKEISF